VTLSSFISPGMAAFPPPHVFARLLVALLVLAPAGAAAQTRLTLGAPAGGVVGEASTYRLDLEAPGVLTVIGYSDQDVFIEVNYADGARLEFLDSGHLGKPGLEFSAIPITGPNVSLLIRVGQFDDEGDGGAGASYVLVVNFQPFAPVGLTPVVR
jgi:hypothetical protein